MGILLQNLLLKAALLTLFVSRAFAREWGRCHGPKPNCFLALDVWEIV